MHYKQGVLKLTEAISKFQPKYAEAISKLQQEYLQLTKEFVDKIFGALNWTGAPMYLLTLHSQLYHTRHLQNNLKVQSNAIGEQALSVFDTSNRLAISALNGARENLKLYQIGYGIDDGI